MKRVVLLIAVLTILPALVAVAWFGPRLLQWSNRSSEAAKPAASESPAVVQQPAEPSPGQTPPPPVEGPVLRPQEIPGRTVSKPFAEERSERTVVVRPGDSLFKIAVDHFDGDSTYVDDILVLNPGLNPNALKVGQKVLLPPKRAKSRTEDAGSSASNAEEQKVYVVRQGDNLVAIARRMYADSAMAKAIFDSNRDVLKTPEAVRPGMRLRLPPPPKF